MRLAGLTAAVIVVLAGCSRTVPGAADPAGAQSAATVDPAALKPGGYPTTPLPPLGTAGSEDAGRLVEGRRLVDYVVGPWQADPAMTDGRRTGALVITADNHLGAILWPEVSARSWPQPFVVAFSSERRAVDPKAPAVLRNAVLLYATADAAGAAALAMSDAALQPPTVENSDAPIAGEPIHPVPIPGHAGLNGALAVRRDGDRTLKELTVISAHGPCVLVQVAESNQDDDRIAAVTGRLLDLQAALIDRFQPTQPGHFASLPLDPTGMVARTLPLKSEGDSMSNAAYSPTGALHLEDNPVLAQRAFADAGVDVVSTSQTTVYRAKDAASARRLAQALGDDIAKRPASQPAPTVPGLPESNCKEIDTESGLVPRYWCIATFDRFAFKAVARQMDNAQQQMAAQYLILTR